MLIGVGRQRSTKVFSPYRGVVETTSRPSRIQFPEGAPERQTVLPAKFLQGPRRIQGCCGVSAQDFELRFPPKWMRHRWATAEFARAPVRLID
jgi:hypothetical protein